jgi:hypothetical protein
MIMANELLMLAWSSVTDTVSTDMVTDLAANAVTDTVTDLVVPDLLTSTELTDTVVW